MLLLKAFLLHWRPEDGWNITVHRDLESITDACKLADFELNHTVVIHIGFWRPDADAFLEVVERFPGVVLVTSSTKDALPQPLATTGKPVCLVQGIGLYPILSGWGYETSAAKLGVASEWQRQLAILGNAKPSLQIPLPLERSECSEWVARLAFENPEAHQAALDFGIFDDASLFTKELALPEKLRSLLNVCRFKFITGGFPHCSIVLDKLHLAGPALLSTPFSILELSVRANNVFTKHNINFVNEIAVLKTEGLLKLKNMGRGTVTELSYLMMGLWFPGFDQNDAKTDDEKGIVPDQITSIEIGNDASNSENCSTDLFKTHLELALNRLPANRQIILRSRMGLEGDPKTLEEIGKELEISRERVRQLEAAGIQLLKRNAILNSLLDKRLLGLLENRRTALPLFGLEVIDPWFTGVAESPRVIKWVLEHCCDGDISIIQHNGQHYISRIQQSEWDSLIASTMNLMKAQAGTSLTKSQAHALVTGMLIGHGDDLRDELWETVLPDLNFSSVGDEELLVNVGSDLASILTAVLIESPGPLHMNEIASRLLERTGRQFEGNQIRKVLGEIGFLFGRGTYGLRSHLDLTDQELEILRMEIEELIITADSQRQWHAFEIYSSLAETCPELYPRITPHVIGISLKKSEQLLSLGRMVWTAKQAVSNGSSFRIDIHQAIVSLLRDKGRPMTAIEIRKTLLCDRGLNSTFQILMEDPLIRVGRGVWGLADRDLPYSEQEQKHLVDALLLMLNQRQKGIHYSVLIPELLKFAPSLDLSVDPTLLLSIALRSGHMKVDTGQYLFLSEWGQSRWPSNTEVVSEILANHPSGGWTIADLLPLAEARLERPLESGYIFKAIESLGGTYDLDNRKWVFLNGAANQYGDE